MAVNANSMAWDDSEPQGIAAKVFGNTLHNNTLGSSAGAIEAIYPYNKCIYHPNRLPVENFGIPLKAAPHEYPNSPVTHYQPESGNLWVTLPRGLPYPWPGRFTHHHFLSAESVVYVGIALDDRFAPDNGRLLVDKSGMWMPLIAE